MNPVSKQFCVAIIAGEASGDQHGAKLVKAMQKKHPALFFCGIGGPALKQAGVRILLNAAELTVVGITEVFSKIPGIIKGIRTVKKLLRALKPDLLILIDFPDFNLHIAGTAKKLGIPVLYYISPQIWAWRRGRVKRIGRLVDHMAVILPFEEQFYRENNVPVTFVGHPLLDAQLPAAEQPLKNHRESKSVIGLVPGSRDNEIARHLPVMLNAAEILKEKLNHVKFIISHAHSVEKRQIEAIIDEHRRHADVDFEVVSDGVERVFERCDMIVAASGTVTLQAAIHGCPMVVIYKVSRVSYWLGRALVRVPNIGLVNLVAGRQIVPELIQDEACSENIVSAIESMINDRGGLTNLKEQLRTLRDKLGGAGASEKVARIALEMLDR
jgi:lipid-A-disaccharide synthase